MGMGGVGPHRRTLLALTTGLCRFGYKVRSSLGVERCSAILQEVPWQLTATALIYAAPDVNASRQLALPTLF